MMLIPRRVNESSESRDKAKNPQTLLSEYHHRSAWVLLGEPGAGKSEALKQAAQDVSGEYITASEFIVTTPPLGEWLGKTLFIDGLDEARAAGSESLILRIRNQLRQLGQPSFRLSCRAADWHGSTDTAELQRVSPDGELVVLHLCPLSDHDVRQVLQNNHNVQDSSAFIEQAERHGIAPLLSNPQMLGLMARAVSGMCWPESRSEVYRLACEKLAEENNTNHRQISEAKALDNGTVVKAAGQLFAVLLLSSKTGISLDLDASDTGHPTLLQLRPETPEAARRALHSALFAPAIGNAERLIPCHRSVAEYLAAEWLADKLDRGGLPHGRLLNLLLGFDGGVVADMRGMLAWLAQHSISIRMRLIDADPLGIVLYGDVRSFSSAEKRYLLQALGRQAERFPGFRWRLWRDMSAFGALADTELLEDFLGILQTPERNEATQSLMDIVLDILDFGPAYPCLVVPLLAIIKDSSFWPRLRYAALRVWFRLATTEQIRKLLSEISSNQVEDEDEELLGKLLDQLYPETLITAELPQYLHPPKNSRLTGCYRMFWEHWLPERASADQLPALLEDLCSRLETYEEDSVERMLSRSIDRLLVRTIEELGESASDEQLLKWLGSGANQYGYFNRDGESLTAIRHWLERHPERYKAVLDQCVQAMAANRHHYQYLLLHGATPPADVGLWHLRQAGASEEVQAKIHLQNAVNSLMWQRGAEGLSIEMLEAWALACPKRNSWLRDCLTCDLEQERWRLEDAARTRPYKEQQAEQRRQRTQRISTELSAIAAGTAAAAGLEELAWVWLKRFPGIHGETLSERFANYSELGDELMRAAESGFRQCLQRPDLPSAADIISLNRVSQRYFIGLPCLLGLQLSWAANPETTTALPDDLIEMLLAFYFCQPYFGLDGLDGWATQIARQHPKLFSRVLVQQVSAAFAVGNVSAAMTHPLGRDSAYDQVAQIAAPELLRQFPESASGDQLTTLRQLLGAALKTNPECLAALARNKLESPQLHVDQQLPWLAINMLAGHAEGEDKVWRWIAEAEEANIAMLVAAEVLMQGVQLQALQIKQPERILSRLIEAVAQHADFERHRGGLVTTAMDLSDELRAMIDWLGSQPSIEAGTELQRLLSCPKLVTERYRIQSTLEQQQVRRREAEFQFLGLNAVADVLVNRAPANVADLTCLALNHLDDIAHELRQANDDGYRSFWNVWTENKTQHNARRGENLCRDILLTRLRSRLNAHGVSIAPEYDHAGDKRADLHLDYRNQLALPIEIKRDDHEKLWTSLHDQLIAQYAHAPKSAGHGIYLVLWFGESRKLKGPPNREVKPATPEELRAKLEAQLTDAEHQKVFVRVLDVSWL